MALFTLLYFVFGHIFKLNTIPYYPQALLMGIVLFFYFSDATSITMYSLVSRESMLRKLIFPRMVIPISATLTSTITFGINLVVVGIFVAAAGITPDLSWFLLVPLMVELFVFVLGVGLILATLFVRLRDISQLWDLVVQLFMYASPIMYPVGYLPPWAQKIVFLNPFTQILQDARAIVLYSGHPTEVVTASDALGTYGRLLPVAIAFGILILGSLLFRREEPWFAERI
jgi:ABC-2 type transport system permease protein